VLVAEGLGKGSEVKIMEGNLKQFKTIKDIDRSIPEGELARRLLLELCSTEQHQHTKINDMLRLVADKTYCTHPPREGDLCYSCKLRK